MAAITRKTLRTVDSKIVRTGNPEKTIEKFFLSFPEWAKQKLARYASVRHKMLILRASSDSPDAKLRAVDRLKARLQALQVADRAEDQLEALDRLEARLLAIMEKLRER